MASRRELIRAIDLYLSGDWAGAQAIVAAHASDRRACEIHAILHRRRGDTETARRWYAEAGIFEWPASDPEGQLLRLRDELLHQP
ncbi:MAG: hypothetical protein NW205_01465 [Hyphomicrobiaceae bacterium]|nr:hypothetical protein [Hyphomicrobiaceae bacterium]